MAVTLDYGVLGQLSNVLLGLLIFVIAYGLLRMTDFFDLGEKGKGIYGLLAIVLAFILMLSDVFVTILSFTLPWYAVMIMVIFMLLLFAKIADPDADLTEGPGAGKYIFISLFVIIFLFGLGEALGPTVRSAQDGTTTTVSSTMPEDTFIPADQASIQTTESTSTVAAVMFHPNVLGMAFILLVAVAALFTITSPITLKK